MFRGPQMVTRHARGSRKRNTWTASLLWSNTLAASSPAVQRVVAAAPARRQAQVKLHRGTSSSCGSEWRRPTLPLLSRFALRRVDLISRLVGWGGEAREGGSLHHLPEPGTGGEHGGGKWFSEDHTVAESPGADAKHLPLLPPTTRLKWIKPHPPPGGSLSGAAASPSRDLSDGGRPASAGAEDEL